jgi:hypothetical protein
MRAGSAGGGSPQPAAQPKATASPLSLTTPARRLPMRPPSQEFSHEAA